MLNEYIDDFYKEIVMHINEPHGRLLRCQKLTYMLHIHVFKYSGSKLILLFYLDNSRRYSW